jgi:hypothetical protein
MREKNSILLQKSFIPGKNPPSFKNLAGLAQNFSGQLYETGK